MARKKQRGKSHSRRIPWRDRLPDRAVIVRAAAAFGWLAIMTLLVLGAMFGVPRLEAYAARATDSWHHSVDPQNGPAVRFVDQPAWVDRELSERLRRTVLQQFDGDGEGDAVFDRDALVRMRAALLDTGWFEEVRQVRRTRRDLIEVEASFVRPFALVRNVSRQRDYLVDVEGRALPKEFPMGGAAAPYPIIIGAARSGPAPVGEKWPGADVHDGLLLLHVIVKQPWREQIVAVDVGRYLTRQRLDLLTDRDVRIIWGRAPGDVSMGEITTEEKVRNLTALYRNPEYGRIDGGFRNTELDIRGPVASKR